MGIQNDYDKSVCARGVKTKRRIQTLSDANVLAWFCCQVTKNAPQKVDAVRKAVIVCELVTRDGTVLFCRAERRPPTGFLRLRH